MYLICSVCIGTSQYKNTPTSSDFLVTLMKNSPPAPHTHTKNTKFPHGKTDRLRPHHRHTRLQPSAERLTFHILWGYWAGFPGTCWMHMLGGGRQNQEGATQSGEAVTHSDRSDRLSQGGVGHKNMPAVVIINQWPLIRSWLSFLLRLNWQYYAMLTVVASC